MPIRTAPAPFTFIAFLAFCIGAIPGGSASAQTILDYQNAAKASSMGMLPGFPGSAKLSGFPGQGAEGMQAIQDMNVLFETVNDSAYVMGTGDVLVLGLGSRMATIPVNPEGFAVIDGIGPVRVSDMTLREAKGVLMAKIESAYKGDRLFVTLAKAKKIQASIVGAVQMPGVYVVTAAARITDFLLMAQGYSSNASKLVTVVGRDGSRKTYDLDKYYLGNDIAHNPYVRAGDMLKAEEVDYDKPVLMIRESETINAIQLKEGQSAYDAVSAYNSIKKHKIWDKIAVFDGETQVALLGIKEAKSYFPKSGQVLEVKSYKPTVFVGGAVLRPSYFDFNANYNAMDYIATAGIMPTTGSIDKIRVIGPDGQERRGNATRIAPGDHILVPESKESRVRDYIALLASVASIVTSITLTVITLQK